MAVITVTKENFQEQVLNASNTVLLDFWATWCGPCKMMAPVIDKIAEENPELNVAKVNVDESGELAAQFGIAANKVFLLRRAATNLRKFDKAKLEKSFDAIIKTEKELKSYAGFDRAAVEKLVVRLIYIMKTGESLD